MSFKLELLEWAAPLQKRESGVAAVGRDPGSTVFDGERRMVGVGNQIGRGGHIPAQLRKDLPVFSTRP